MSSPDIEKPVIFEEFLASPAEDAAAPVAEQAPEDLERKKLATLVDMTVDRYCAKSMPVLRGLVRRGEEKGVIKMAAAKNYKLGDSEISIDPIGENILHDAVEAIKLPAVIHGEHQTFDSPTGEDAIHFAIDPFDNTSEYAAGLDTPPWTVVSAYFSDGTPIAAFIGNIKDNKGYFLQNGEVFEKDMENGEKRTVRKSERKSLMEPGSVMASYIGSSEYSGRFNREFNDFTGERPAKSLFYGEGGAFIYGKLAAGVVDAYVMFDEPYEEIDPGAAIALAAGCTIGHYDIENDMWIDYKYQPDRDESNTPEDKKGTVNGLFIAAATPDIRDELVNYYKSKNKIAVSSGLN